MAFLFILLCMCHVCYSCSAHIKTKNRVKVLEDYVVSADFDKNSELPQLRMKDRRPWKIDERLIDETESRIMNGDHFHNEPQQFAKQHAAFESDPGPHDVSDKYEGGVLNERDVAAVGHSHGVLVSSTSLASIGFLLFLILLSILQNNLILMLRQPSLLGSITGSLTETLTGAKPKINAKKILAKIMERLSQEQGEEES